MSQRFASDYIDVAARLVEFREKHPDGCLQPADPTTPYRVETIAGDTFIVVVAAAYRSESDPRPGIGMAYEIYPGRTNFTRGSELQNAETSAWGRAIVAALAADTKRGVASAEEVRNRSAEREDPVAVAKAEVWEHAKRLGLDLHGLRDRFADAHAGLLLDGATAAQLRAFAEVLSREGANGLPLNKDGSVARRKTTEEERVEVGMMSDEERKAHKALVEDVQGDEKKAARGSAATLTEDPWANIPVATPGGAE